MLKELVKLKVLSLSEKYYPLLGFLKDFAQRCDLRAERHQFKFVINSLNFKYCGWCYTLRNITSDGLYECFPFIRECKENHRGTYNVDVTLHHDRDSIGYRSAIFQQIIQFIELNNFIDVSMVNFVRYHVRGCIYNNRFRCRHSISL